MAEIHNRRLGYIGHISRWMMCGILILSFCRYPSVIYNILLYGGGFMSEDFVLKLGQFKDNILKESWIKF